MKREALDMREAGLVKRHARPGLSPFPPSAAGDCPGSSPRRRTTRHASRTTLACLALVALLVGCTSPTTLRSDYGVAIESAKQAQTLRSATDTTAEPVRGLDGRAADFIMKRYRQSFEQTQTTVQPPTGAPADGMTFGGPPVNPVVP